MDIALNRNKMIKRISFANTALLILTVSCFLFLVSCAKSVDNVTSPEKTEDAGIHETYENGPAVLTLDTDRSSMTIADRLNLSVGVVVDEDYEVTMPDLSGRLEKFGLVDWHTTQPELTDNNKKKITRTYLLEPFLSGDYVIPAMEVRFFKKGEDHDNSHSVSTSEITIKVDSILPADTKDMKMNDIKPPVPYPVNYGIWLAIGGGVLLLATAGVMTWIYVMRRRKMVDAHAVMLSPHEVAYRELEELAAENLIERGEIKAYYQRVSGILRRYIENRFGLRAPEQTTEEFLAGLDADKGLPDNYKPLLRAFLRHCDLVKFAEFRPGREESLRTFESCKDFIKGTEAKEVAEHAV